MSPAPGAAFDLAAYLDKWRQEVDRVLDEVLPAGDSRLAPLHQAMRYAVFSGGKRLRPTLTAAAGEAVGGDSRRGLKTMAAIEMIHAYSLIHDDLPALDDDDLRRGRPTCHKQFNEAIAILAGDGLLTEAFGLIVRDDGLSDQTRAILVSELVGAAGVQGIVGGQAMDVLKEGEAFTADDVLFIHAHKTAAMIEFSVKAGAIIADAGAKELGALATYGHAIGVAFQIIDDVLNVTGGPELGKAVGSDAARGKATYPALFGVEGSRRRALELKVKALEAIDGLGPKAVPLVAIAELVVNRSK